MGLRETIKSILADGLPHKREELLELCAPSGRSALRQHIFHIRKTLPVGQDIVCITTGRTFYYRQVRLLASAHNGRT